VRGFNREDVEFAHDSHANHANQYHEKIVGADLIGMVFVMFVRVSDSIIGPFSYGMTLPDGQERGFDAGTLLPCFGFQMMGDFTLLGLQPSLEPEEKAFTAGSSILKLAQYEPKIGFGGGEQIPDSLGKIESANVSFKSAARACVLKNGSFTIEPRQIAAPVGQSRVGKSTCGQLIERFSDPTDGITLMDGRDTVTLDRRWLHRKIELVAQEPVLFQTTIRETFWMGSTRTLMRKCLRQ
jgi:ABC-type multidrug transport system fused ATPase/permease subunit